MDPSRNQPIPSTPRRNLSDSSGLNTVESGYEAKIYKFNNRKDDAVFSKDNCSCRYVTPNSMYTRANSSSKEEVR